MEKPFFLMMFTQRGDHASPAVDDDGEVMFWHTKGEADEAMRGHIYAEAFGYEVHEIGAGGCA